jgi:hypothetical protein
MSLYLRLLLQDRESYSTDEVERLRSALAAAPGVADVGRIERHPRGGYAVFVERSAGDDLDGLLVYLRGRGYLAVF